MLGEERYHSRVPGRTIYPMRRSAVDRSGSMSKAAWEKVCTLAATLIFNSDGTMPSGNAVGEAARMLLREVRQ